MAGFDLPSFRQALRRLSAQGVATSIETQTDIDENIIGAICYEVMTCDRLILRGREANRAGRDAVLAALTGESVPSGLREQLVDIVQVLLLIDRAYDVLLRHRSESPLGKVSPDHAIAITLNHAARLFFRLHQESLKPQTSPEFVVIKARRTIEFDGECVDPDVAATSIAKAAVSVVKMEAAKNDWVAEDQTIVLPFTPQPSAADAQNLARLDQNLAIAWDQWHRNEERIRYEGGGLSIRRTEELPAEAALTFGDYSPQYAFIVARDEEALQRSSLIEIARTRLISRQTNDAYISQNLVAHLVAIANRQTMPALAPEQYIAPIEATAYQELCEIYGASESHSSTKIGGLSLAEWLRAYVVLQEIVREQFAAHGESGLIIQLPIADLRKALVDGGLSTSSSDLALSAFSLRLDSIDLFDAPVIRCADERVILFGPALASSIPVMVLFSVLQRFSDIATKGPAFESRLREYLKRQGFDARSIHFRDADGAEFECDILFEWDDVIFHIECKNWLLPFGSPIREVRFVERVDDAKAQVARQKQGLLNNRHVLVNAFGEAARTKRVVSVLCTSLPYWEPAESLDDILVIDAPILQRFFDEPKLNIVRLHQIGDTQIQHRHGIRMLWTGEKPTLAQFLDYLAQPPQVVVAMAALALNVAWFALTDETVVTYPSFGYRELTAEEEIRAAGGDPATVLQELREYEEGFQRLRSLAARNANKTYDSAEPRED